MLHEMLFRADVYQNLSLWWFSTSVWLCCTCHKKFVVRRDSSKQKLPNSGTQNSCKLVSPASRLLKCRWVGKSWRNICDLGHWD